MNWIKINETLPSEGQAIWYRHTLWPAERVSEFAYWNRHGCVTQNTLIWQPAQPPPAPPDESDTAFSEWLNYHRYDQWKTSDEGIQAAWNAGRDWEKKNKSR